MNNYRIFTVNDKNEIVFSKEELQNILNEVYKEGFFDGSSNIMNNSKEFMNPSITPVNPLNPYINFCSPTIGSTTDTSTVTTAKN